LGFLIFVGLFVAFVVVGSIANSRQERSRARFIEEYAFPPALEKRVRELHPEIADADVAVVLDGLRQWFLACLYAASRQRLAMPSRAVDDAWHEFILMTRTYEEFCERAFGRYLNHTPNSVAPKPTPEAMPATLQLLEKRQLAAVGVLPLLFAVDDVIGVTRGRSWTRETVFSFGGGSSTAGGDCSSGGCGGGDCGGCGGCGGCCA
jgi:hypothetical protein